jgi:hypothetical protein
MELLFIYFFSKLGSYGRVENQVSSRDLRINRVSSIIISEFVPRPHNKDPECCFLSEDGRMLNRNLKSALCWATKAQRGSRGIAPLFL